MPLTVKEKHDIVQCQDTDMYVFQNMVQNVIKINSTVLSKYMVFWTAVWIHST